MAQRVEFEDVKHHLWEVVVPEVRQSIKPRLLLSHQRRGRVQTIKLVHSTGGRPHAVVTRMANGVVALKGFPEAAYHSRWDNLAAHVQQPIDDAIDRMTALLMRKMRGKFGSPAIDALLFDRKNRLVGEIRLAGLRLGQAHFSRMQGEDGRRRKMAVHSLGKVLKEIMTRDFVDAEVSELARDVRFGWNVHESLYRYNQMLLNRSVFEPLHATTPAVLQLYLRYLDPLPEQDGNTSPLPIVLDAPSDVVRACRAATGWSDAQWHYFTGYQQLPHAAYNSKDALDDIGAGLELAVAVNAPRHGLVVREQQDHPIVSSPITSAYHRACSTHWNAGNARQAFINILKAFNVRSLNARAVGDINRILDTFDYHLLHDLPWTKANQEGYRARSARYHRMMAEERYANRQKSADYMEWESLVPAMVVGDLKVEPILNSDHLTRIARTMGNCLANYRQRCAQGEERVFTLRDNRTGALRAATAIAISASYRWHHHQHSFYGEAAPELHRKMLDIIDDLPERYNLAYMRQVENGAVEAPVADQQAA